MDRFRLVVAIAALVATITLGVSWNSGMAQAASAECNCLMDGPKDRVYMVTILTRKEIAASLMAVTL